jgi:hypothetical protein
MSSDADKVFDLVANKLRKKQGLCPPTPEEAAEAFKKAKAIPLTEEEHESIVEAMLSQQTQVPDYEQAESWRGAPLNQEIDSECQAIYRNPGEDDEEANRLEAKIDQELLAEDDDEV